MLAQRALDQRLIALAIAGFFCTVVDAMRPLVELGSALASILALVRIGVGLFLFCGVIACTWDAGSLRHYLGFRLFLRWWAATAGILVITFFTMFFGGAVAAMSHLVVSIMLPLILYALIGLPAEFVAWRRRAKATASAA